MRSMHVRLPMPIIMPDYASVLSVKIELMMMAMMDHVQMLLCLYHSMIFYAS